MHRRSKYPIRVVAIVILVTAVTLVDRRPFAGAATVVTVSPTFTYVATDGGNGAYEAFPDVTRLADGRLMTVFYEGYTHISPPTESYPTGGRVMYATSANEGVSWSTPAVLYDTPQDDRDPSITQLADGRLLSTYFTYNGGGLGTYIVESRNRGASWSTPRKLADSPYYVSSPVRRLSDGRLAVGLYSEAIGQTAHGAVALSDDGGANWTSPIDIPNPSGAYLDAETDLIELKNGNLWAIQRSSGSPAQSSVSTDHGKTWSGSQSLGFIAHSPYLLRTQHEGLILLGYRGYDAAGHGYTALRYSLDDCSTWSDPIPVDWDCIGAYPSMVNLNDGSVLITYYEEGGASNIRARTITITGLPEPSGVVMLATAVLGLVGYALRKRISRKQEVPRA